MSMPCCLGVLVQTPAYAALGSVLTYQSEQPLPAGTLVRVPLGSRETLGVVWDNWGDMALPSKTASQHASPTRTASIEQGRYLALAGNCMACHTRADQGDFDDDRVRIPK